MDTLRSDVRSALRWFARQPGFFAASVITLALGIGATTAIFSVVSAVLLRPLPYADADRLVRVRGSYADLADLRDAAPRLEGLAISASNLYDMGVEGNQDFVRGDVVTPDFFAVLGVKPRLGRIFTAEEDKAGELVTVISDKLWQRRFGGSPLALGKSLVLYNKPYTIVGILPPHIGLPSEQTELWVPIHAGVTGNEDIFKNRAFRIYRGFGRLAPGATLTEAQAASDVVAANLARAYPESNAQTRFALTPLRESIVGDVRPALLVLLGTVGFVLLIACANVAHLMLARTLARGREMAVRMALGAGRFRIARQILTESVLLAFFGGALGLLLAMWGVDLLRALGPSEIPRLGEIALDGTVLAFAAGVTVLVGVLFGLAPAMSRVRAPLATLLHSGRGNGDPRRGALSRRLLVVGEVALSLMLVVGASLLGRSFLALVRVDPGVDVDRVLAVNLPPSDVNAPPEQHTARFVQIVERVGQIPGVTRAAAALAVPPVILQRGTEVVREGSDTPGGAAWVPATPGFFATTGGKLLAGRDFTRTDDAGAAPVVILSASLARREFGDVESAVGRRLKLINPSQRTGGGDVWRTVVGVAADIHFQGLAADVPDTLYTPLVQTPFIFSYLLVRTAGPPAAMIEPVRAAIREVAPEQSAANPKPLAAYVSESVAEPRFHTMMLGVFALVALVLASIGIYGLVAYGVAQRSRDIGIRIALGAGRGQVMRWVLGQGLGLSLAGVVVGLLGALALSRLLEKLLFAVSPTEPIIYAGVALLLLVITALASWLPARRAARVDPMIAMRVEG